MAQRMDLSWLNPGKIQMDILKYGNDTLIHVSVSDSHEQWTIVTPPEVKACEHSSIGTGGMNFREIITSLKAMGYTDYLSVHLISEIDRIEKAASETRKVLQDLLAE